MNKEQLRKALEDAANAWILNYWGDQADAMLERIAIDIADFQQAYEGRFGQRPDPFALLQSDPYKGRAFFQIDTLMVSVEMKIMIWRIFLGCDIRQIEFQYDMSQPLKLTIVLGTPHGVLETYHGTQARDFRVLRHLGVLESNGQLILHGYYAHRSTEVNGK